MLCNLQLCQCTTRARDSLCWLHLFNIGALINVKWFVNRMMLNLRMVKVFALKKFCLIIKFDIILGNFQQVFAKIGLYAYQVVLTLKIN